MKILKLADAGARKAIARMREKLSVSAAAASVESRKRTIDVFGETLTPVESVRRIVADVRRQGDEAVLRYTKLLDGIELSAKDIRLSRGEISLSLKKVSKEFLDAARRAIDRVRRFQKHILLRKPSEMAAGGRRLGVKYVPVRRVGAYVPGFSAVLPSSVIMNCVPAQVAGVEEIALCTPPAASGEVCPEILACCGLLGMSEVYAVGGAQAIAALAFGTASIGRVDMVIGPGSIFTTLAKKEVFGEVGIDILAGPSEVLVLADDSARADVVAAEMLSQAEHAPAAAFLVTTSEKLAKDAAAEVERQLADLPRRDRTRAVLRQYSLVIVTETMDEAIEVTNDLAPEHLQISTSDNEGVLARIRNAGAVFVGEWTPVAAGDYYAGPSHTLPTGGTARFFSGLSANAFLKRMSIIRYDKTSLAEDKDDIITLAESEGLHGHARSVRIRFNKREQDSQNGRKLSPKDH
jgi:histidinol dehydrogenase